VLGARAILGRHVMAQRAAALLGELNASKAASQEHAKERSGAEAEARTLRAQLDVRTAEAAAEIERLKRQCCDQSSQARTKKQTNKCLVQCTRRAATSATRCNNARPAGSVRTAHNVIQVHAEYDAVVGNLRDILQRFRTEKEASDRQACSARPGPGQG
jgi:hypothetical protein